MTPSDEPVRRARHRRAWVVGIAGLLIICGIMLALRWRGHDAAAFYPECVWHKATGTYCPGCGTTRAACALWHGEVGRAFRYNPLMFVLMPLVVAMGVSSFGRPRQGKLPLSLRLKPWIFWGSFAVLMIYWVLRNIPFKPFSYLAPGGA